MGYRHWNHPRRALHLCVRAMVLPVVVGFRSDRHLMLAALGIALPLGIAPRTAIR